MNILGIMHSTNATAAVMRDGEVVACLSEDRLAHRKATNAYPRRAIEGCLDIAGLRPDEVDLVAVPYEGMFTNFDKVLVDYDGAFSVREKIEEQYRYYKPLLLEGQRPDFLKVFQHKIIPDRLRLAQTDPQGNYILAALKEHLGIPADRVKTYHHHLSHLYYAIHTQRTFRDPVLIFGMEGWGGDRNASIARFANGTLETLSQSAECCIGRLYRYITLLLGMKSNQHEYKLMGLAPYASEHTIQEALAVFRKTMYVEGVEFKYHERPRDLFFYFKERLEAERFDGIAGALQRYTEEIITQWVRNGIERFGLHDILFTGGVAMNIKAMMEVGKLPGVNSLWVGATPSDESTAIGVLFLAHTLERGETPKPMSTVYLGDAYDAESIRRFIEQQGPGDSYRVRRMASPDEAAERLAEGKVVARFAGRAEFGARALGNRSILADPRQPSMIRTINEKIKNRDFWMPFAPVILKERQHDYLVNPKELESPYMTVGFETTAKARQDIPAALHPYDFTARPQILQREDNPEYYAIVKAFERRTGVGALLNTSFNLHGEAIVSTLEDAWRVFTRSGIDVLLLGDYLVEKRDGAVRPASRAPGTMAEPVLTGARVSLRPFREGDLTERYLGWLNDPLVTRYLEVGKTPVTWADARAYVERFARKESGWLLAIMDRASGQHIGTVTLNHIDREHGTATTGLMLGEQAFWGKGYAGEAWSLLIDFAFTQLGLRRIAAGAVVGNTRSIKVLEKLGFVMEGKEQRTVAGAAWEAFRFALAEEAFVPSRHARSAATPGAAMSAPATLAGSG